MQDALRYLDLEGRWKLMIIAQLLPGPVMRFSDLERAIPKISQKMLIQQLRDLEEDRNRKGPEARLRCSSRLGRIAAVRNFRARKLVSTKAELMLR
jgi:HxlR-like helix-turn-helix